MRARKEKNPVQTPSIEDVWMAKKRIHPYVRRTPLISSPQLAGQPGIAGDVFLKLENLQDIGSFKIRGAANKMLSLIPEQQSRGVCTFSTGNHGFAVASMAARLGLKAVVCISDRVPEAKVKAIESLGGQIEVVGQSQDEAEEYCQRLQQKHGLTVIAPFDDPHIIAGQGTIGLELLEEEPGLDTVVVPLSGGGLLAGITLAIKSNHPRCRLIGVSMQEGAVMYHSLRAGHPLELEEQETLADSLLGGIGLGNRYTFSLVQKCVDDTILISEKAIARGMAYLYEQHKLVVEGAAAVGVGALLEGKITGQSEKMAIIISGHNVDLHDFQQAIHPYVSK